MARSFLAAGTPVVLATPRPSPLRALDGQGGVLRLFTTDDLDEEEFADALRVGRPPVRRGDRRRGDTEEL
jgi:S-DNA-T family DNA segregation ATPase FtsK/SpoIIIE